ncbi:hypothetical protein GH714_013351 [Hevea brasiliensis]|uniref:DUF4283 domain-containing protein n=1 Tax=Hevea brasiliensis TaxID=3981 RepID=A0A6A6N049_HEVBR|nr:hypothetical protein GH714_013351 [Hevea brasiliensis]
MQYSKENLIWLFYNVSSSSLILFLFLYFSSTLLLKLLNFFGSYPIFQRSQNGYEYNLFSDEKEEVDTETCYYTEPREKDHLVADIIHDSESEHNDADHMVEEEEEEMTARDADSVQDSAPDHGSPTTTIATHRQKSGLVDSDENYGAGYINQELENRKADKNFNGDERFFIFAPTLFESKKLQVPGKDDEEIFGDLCTVGSTSKSSSEWRSSIKDSGTEDPFSSSSRRTCPKWESYTVFQKYDEEMMFLDRISAQKLHETDSLKSIQVCPRSISDRIVHKITTMNKKPSDIRQNPYHELEAAYVAQICLTWEALNWNYKNFHSKRASQRDFYPGCPGHIAQQFQQFQVLLQRYIENEPYEQGRRPEVKLRNGLSEEVFIPVHDSISTDNGMDQKHLANGYFMARFSNQNEYERVLSDGPWMVVGHYLTVHQWRPNFDPDLAQIEKAMRIGVPIRIDDTTLECPVVRGCPSCVPLGDAPDPILVTGSSGSKAYKGVSHKDFNGSSIRSKQTASVTGPSHLGSKAQIPSVVVISDGSHPVWPDNVLGSSRFSFLSQIYYRAAVGSHQLVVGRAGVGIIEARKDYKRKLTLDSGVGRARISSNRADDILMI